jgi:hypothetical protein
MHDGRVFSDRNIQRPLDQPPEVQAEIVASQITAIFLPLGLLDADHQQRLLAMAPALFYEYLQEAGPRSVNGYPQFTSLRIVTEEEWPTLNRYLTALETAPDPLAQC